MIATRVDVLSNKNSNFFLCVCVFFFCFFFSFRLENRHLSLKLISEIISKALHQNCLTECLLGNCKGLDK